jgi:hypothetical protein
MFSFYQWLEARQRTFSFMGVNKIDPEEAKRMKLIGPVYHGTSQTGREGIEDYGFKSFVGAARTGDVSHGYELSDYWGGIPAPIHHCGFGIYFTNVKNIGKMYNQNTTKGLKPYYIHASRLETINFGSPKNMMKWWQANGYDMQPTQWNTGATGNFQGIPVVGKVPSNDKVALEQQRVKATINLTNHLKAKFDAVWFKGKGIKRLLDGDQICVFDPNNIYELDMENYKGKDMGDGIFAKEGDRFVIKGTKATAVITSMRELTKEMRDIPWDHIVGKSNYYLTINNVKGWDQVGQVYKDSLKKAILQYQSDFLKERLATIRGRGEEITPEQDLEYVVNYYLRQDTYNFPSALVGKVLQKGERFN